MPGVGGICGRMVEPSIVDGAVVGVCAKTGGAKTATAIIATNFAYLRMRHSEYRRGNDLNLQV